MLDEQIEQVAKMLIARRWGCESDFGPEPTDTFIQWPPTPRPPMRVARGTTPPERETDDDYEVELDFE